MSFVTLSLSCTLRVSTLQRVSSLQTLNLPEAPIRGGQAHDSDWIWSSWAALSARVRPYGLCECCKGLCNHNIGEHS